MRDELLKRFRGYRKVLVELNRASNSFSKADSDQEEALKKEKEIREEMGKGAKIVMGVAILIVIACIVGAFISLVHLNWLGIGFFVSFALACMGFANALTEYMDIKYYRADKIRDAEKYHNEVVRKYDDVMEAANKEMNKYQDTPEYIDYIDTIPQKYRSLDWEWSVEVLDYFIDALETKRADNEKELYNLYEADQHQQELRRIEEERLAAEKERLAVIEEQTVRCPKCGSANCHIISESRTTGTSFNIGDGCCGAILLGPVGWLCGFCGAGYDTTTETYWLCSNCGKKFKD